MTFRNLCFIGFLICAGLVSTALYYQHVDGLDPCPLCIFQRVAFIAMGVLFLMAALHNPPNWGKRIYAILIGLAGLFGISIAGRHVWLQNLPEDQVPECGPGLEFMLDAFPLKKVFETVLRGSGECADVLWTFLGLSMPTWSLVWLVLMTLLALKLLFGRTA